MRKKLLEISIRLGQVNASINELYAEKKALEKELLSVTSDLRELAGKTGKTAYELLEGEAK